MSLLWEKKTTRDWFIREKNPNQLSDFNEEMEMENYFNFICSSTISILIINFMKL